ncbi:hypothetical protein PFLU3_56920 [Pseudomonas fluorescens]|uniref:Uncharacterized protein n=1 Tax=Pseudomonas fluorescens TaxID=294 RepID=A0A0D0SV08_PSEFL|nr:hypothetical protein PFLU3_56920 [Pseudomonas fluorescens]
MGATVALFRRARAIRRQLQYAVFSGQLGGPVGQLAFTLAGVHPLALPGGIVGVLDGQGGQWGGLPGLGRAVQADQLFNHQLHRPAIGNDVVLGKYQYMVIVRQAQQPDPQQRAALQVEQLSAFVLYKGFERGVVRRAVQRFDHEGQLCLCGDDLPGLFVVHHKGGAQGFMAGDELVEGLLQRRDIQRALETQGGRQVVGGAVRVQLPEEPLAFLGVGQGQRLIACDGRQGQLILTGAAVQAGDEIPKHAAFEQAAQGHVNIQGVAYPGDDPGRQQRVATQSEKVVREPHLLKAQHALPDPGDLNFQRRSRCHISFLQQARIRFRQSLAIQFAVGAQGQLIEEDQLRRHHVVGQVFAQALLDLAAQFIGFAGFGRYGIGDQLAVGSDHHGFAHAVQFHQAGFDFPQLDTQAADFHLVVDAPPVFDHAVGAITGQVAGAVQALAVAERAGHEALGGQGGTAVVATSQASAAQVQLADHPRRHRLQLGVEDVGAEVGDRLADGHAGFAFFAAGPVGHVDGGFGGAVEVEQPGVRQLGEDLLLRVHGQGFAAAQDAGEAGAAGDVFIEQKHLQHRRHEVQGADLVALDQVYQGGGVAVVARAGNSQACTGHQRPKELPHRHVEAERGFLQHRIGVGQCVRLLHPAQAVGQGRVPVAGAFWLAGGAGGIDDIGEVFAVNGNLRIDLGIGAHIQVVQRQHRQCRRNW